MTKKPILITTSIAYVNGAPHVGFAMEAIEADTFARWKRLRGYDVFFLTGTDEHGIKIYRTAEEQGISAKELADKNSAHFQELAKTLHISHDDFIRTTEERHIRGAQEFWRRIEKREDLEERPFTGKYCVGCETFYTEKELENGYCPIHLCLPEELTEKNYFFRLSRYSKEVSSLLSEETIEVLPRFRAQEILRFTEDGLKDISFSRPAKSLPWGIPVPEKPDHTMYVWCDALTNYITALGFGSSDEWKHYWEQGEVVHFIGKDILRFHAAIWPAMLLSARLPVPSKICVHGFLTSEGHKMSKSLGNVVDPFAVVEDFEGNPDPLRFFLLSEVPFGRDADFSQKRFLEMYNAKLANGLGNLLSRIMTLSEKAGGVAPAQYIVSPKLLEFTEALSGKIDTFMEQCELHSALQEIFSLVEILNLDIDEKKPWIAIKEDPKSMNTNIADWLSALLLLSQELSPFLPSTAEKMILALEKGEKIQLFPRKEIGK
ncbi:methionine--tRNA ligase [Candidatus Peregrinibacteria bacterium]|nr:MAG: methionine--tRNA ligase [Candidatus Peregrinibacteria bacterium]